MNIPILIVQMLLQIIDKNYDAALERIEAIDKYKGRYAKDDEHFRSNCFIRMLQEIPKGNFRSKKVERRGRPFLADLKTVAINFSNQSHEAEVLPFPVTWAFILFYLK